MRCAWLTAIVIVATGLAGCADQEVTYAGIWKTDCRDAWGVQIRAAGADLYSVSFCGRSGCLPPGEWMPNTRIADDPMYQIDSATTIRIKRKDTGYFTYTRCSADPSWQTQPPG